MVTTCTAWQEDGNSHKLMPPCYRLNCTASSPELRNWPSLPSPEMPKHWDPTPCFAPWASPRSSSSSSCSGNTSSLTATDWLTCTKLDILAISYFMYSRSFELKLTHLQVQALLPIQWQRIIELEINVATLAHWITTPCQLLLSQIQFLSRHRSRWAKWKLCVLHGQFDPSNTSSSSFTLKLSCVHILSVDDIYIEIEWVRW